MRIFSIVGDKNFTAGDYRILMQDGTVLRMERMFLKVFIL